MQTTTEDGIDQRFIHRVTLAAALGGLLFGYDTAIISGAVADIKIAFRLDEYRVGWAVSCILLGCGMGAVLAGPFMEKLGRRRILLTCALLFALSGLGTGMAATELVFELFRITGGLAVGAAAMVSPVYIAEMAPASNRGRLVATYQLAIVSGILLAYLCNYMLSGLGAEGWRWMFGSQLMPASVFFVLLLRVPETPRWLAGQGLRAEALAVLNRIGSSDYADTEIILIEKSFAHIDRDLFKSLLKYRKILLIGILVAVFQQVTGINAILYYAPVIFKETGVSTSGAMLQTVGIGLVNLIATILALKLIDRLGRRRLLIYGSILMGTCLWGEIGRAHV